jgi:hypothetical protein
MNNKYLKYFLVGYLLLIPVIIFIYFLKYRATSIYSDDIASYMTYFAQTNTWDKLNLSRLYQQFRPVRDLALHLMLGTFKKQIYAYYIFNVLMLALNTYVFARIINYILKAPLLSLTLALLLPLSRFSYYAATQLFIGGLMEGIALVFSLVSVLFLMKIMTEEKTEPDKRQSSAVLWSILFANLSMYTHERYMVVLAFIAGVALFFPWLRLTILARIGLATLSSLSVYLNFFLKKNVFHVAVMQGTGGANIEFSIPSIKTFFGEAIYSIFQVNTGPSYICGMPYAALQPLTQKTVMVAVALLVVAIVGLLFAFAAASVRHFRRRENGSGSFTGYVADLQNNPSIRNGVIAFFLSGLFLLLLIPAIVTIRVEQRFLLAPFCILVIIVAIAAKAIFLDRQLLRATALMVVVLVCTFNDYHYLQGTKNLYYSSTDNAAIAFHDAMETGVIRPEATNLYIWEKHRNPDREREIGWVIGGGNLFVIYQGANKNMVYLDSLYQKTDSAYNYALAGFDKKNSQVIFLNIENNGDAFRYTIQDITLGYLTDTLRTFIDTLKK